MPFSPKFVHTFMFLRMAFYSIFFLQSPKKDTSRAAGAQSQKGNSDSEPSWGRLQPNRWTERAFLRKRSGSRQSELYFGIKIRRTKRLAAMWVYAIKKMSTKTRVNRQNKKLSPERKLRPGSAWCEGETRWIPAVFGVNLNSRIEIMLVNFSYNFLALKIIDWGNFRAL